MTTEIDHQDDLINQVLRAASHATEPIGRFDIADAIDPATGDLKEDTAEHEAFLNQRMAIIRAAVEAERAGLLECTRPATGDEPDLLQLSATGRERLQSLA